MLACRLEVGGGPEHQEGEGDREDGHPQVQLPLHLWFHIDRSQSLFDFVPQTQTQTQTPTQTQTQTQTHSQAGSTSFTQGVKFSGST